MRGVLAICLLVSLLTGCAQSEPSAPPVAGSSATDDRVPVLGSAAPPDLNATTAAPPTLVPGEWWRFKYSSPSNDELPELVRVVAASTSEGYIFGMPHESWVKEAIAYHLPAFGDVGLDLSYDLHNERFQPLVFPLEAGATWETAYAASPILATVEAADDTTATIRFDRAPRAPQPTDPVMDALAGNTRPGPFMRLTYDARQHDVVKYEIGQTAWEVVEHGYGFEGWVTVPSGAHTAIDYFARATTASEWLVPKTLDITGGYDRLTVMHVVTSPSSGYYKIRDVAPDGTEFLTEARGESGRLVYYYEAADPDGTWTLEDVVAGDGNTYTMGIAYRQYDILLPEGITRDDHSHEVTR